MAHFAKINENNEVLKVLTIDNKDVLNFNQVEEELIGQQYLETHNNWPAHLWKKCSYNTINGVHKLGGTAFRGTYPSKGMVWDETNQIFRTKQPYASWTFNVSEHKWMPPINQPETTTNFNGKEVPDMYSWDEANQNWIRNDPYYPSA